jgi:tRNA-dihydrouridine synthase B
MAVITMAPLPCQLPKPYYVSYTRVIMRYVSKIPQGSLLFAPMEGITDEPYRMAIQEAFPEWGYLSTDFLRIPTQGEYSEKKIMEHFGERTFSNTKVKNKTAYQILTTAHANTVPNIHKIEALGFDHIDLNLGCPSKKVNGNKGGAYLLGDLPSLKKVIKDIRENFSGLFTAKIRVGFRDDKNFLDILKILEDEGVEAITLHGRTRDQMYEGRADWSYIKKAVEAINIPLIGNGDCWNLFDVEQMFDETGCHAVMLGRGALKTPWLATLFEENKGRIHAVNEEYLLYERQNNLDYYFHLLERNYFEKGLDQEQLLRRFKAFSRYIFDDYPNGEAMRSKFLRSRTLEEFQENLNRIKVNPI